MPDLLKRYENIFKVLVLISSIILIILNAVSILRGFYYTGDAVSLLEVAYWYKPGKLLPIFLTHPDVWPPMTTWIMNIMRFIPLPQIQLSSLLVISVSILNIITVYFIGSLFSKDIKTKIILIALSLFSGVQSLLFQAVLSEPICILLWFMALFSFYKFLLTRKDIWLITAISVSSLIPLTRFLGTINVIGLLLAFYILVYFQKGKGRMLVIYSTFVIWGPILLYLFRNKALYGHWLGTYDAQIPGITLISLIGQNIKQFFLDTFLIQLSSFAIGIKILWQKKYKNFLVLTVSSSVFYLVFLIYKRATELHVDGYPSRYLALTYPVLIIAFFLLGSFFGTKYQAIKRFTLAGYIIVLFTLMNQTYLYLDKSYKELTAQKDGIIDAVYSNNISAYCNNTQNVQKFLFIQLSSRNWISQSLIYYCNNIKLISLDEQNMQLPKGSLLYTPYKLNYPNLDLIDQYRGWKAVNTYQVNNPLILETKKELKKLKLLD